MSDRFRIVHLLSKKVILCILAVALLSSASVITLRVLAHAPESKVTAITPSLSESVTHIEKHETDNYNDIINGLQVLMRKMDDSRRK